MKHIQNLYFFFERSWLLLRDLERLKYENNQMHLLVQLRNKKKLQPTDHVNDDVDV